jgi:hypothetical protein
VSVSLPAPRSDTHWRVKAGATGTAAPLAKGAHKFECLIHPWMRTTITAR